MPSSSVARSGLPAHRPRGRWLVDGDVRPQVFPGPALDSRLRLRLESPWWMRSPSWPLFGALGVALAQAVAGASFAWCFGCGSMYSPKRAPRDGEAHYCDRCRREGVPLRDAKRRQRERERRGAGGKSPTRRAARPAAIPGLGPKCRGGPRPSRGTRG